MPSDADQTLPPRMHIERMNGVTAATFPRHHCDGTCVREVYEFAAELSDLEDPKLLIDLSGLQMLTSGMAGILIQIQKMFRHTGAQLVIAAPDERIFGQFQTMHLDRLLKLFGDREQAIAAFK